MQELTNRQRFLNVMEYAPVDRVPNYEVGVWAQTKKRWAGEGIPEHDLHWDWFQGESYFQMDPREFIPVDFGIVPPFDEEVIEESERHVVFRDSLGRLRKGLKEGAVRGSRLSMDQYLRFPVQNLEDFRNLKKRYVSSHGRRYPPNWRELYVHGWKTRQHVLVLGRNCSTLGFYWRARDWMGTEDLSYAWYDMPGLMHEMMEFIGDFTIEVARPVLAEIDIDYVFINEDMAMKQGPLLGPETYKAFIFPHMKRLVEFLKGNGVRYVIVDSDGNTEPLIPALMDAGVDGLWPLERAACDTDPAFLRKKYGKALRLWGAVDKRELAKGPAAIDAHLAQFRPLIEEGGFIPTVDHLVPPDVPLGHFEHYLRRKRELLEGRF